MPSVVKHEDWRRWHIGLDWRSQNALLKAMMKRSVLLAVCVLAASAFGCRSVYYSTWEALGKHKRDLLKDRVEEVRDDQKVAAEQFKDALTRLQEITRFDGGDLEKTYRALNADKERFDAKADTIRNRIRQVEKVASDLFAEWDKEIEQISNVRLREDSASKLEQTRRRYDDLRSAMKRVERSMEPVLTQLHDYVLYLKHNLNAQAIGSLKGEALSIEQDILQLIGDMNTAIAQAESFTQTLD